MISFALPCCYGFLKHMTCNAWWDLMPFSLKRCEYFGRVFILLLWHKMLNCYKLVNNRNVLCLGLPDMSFFMQILFLDMSLLGCQTSGNLGQIAIANGLTDLFSVAVSPAVQGLSELLDMSYTMHFHPNNQHLPDGLVSPIECDGLHFNL